MENENPQNTGRTRIGRKKSGAKKFFGYLCVTLALALMMFNGFLHIADAKSLRNASILSPIPDFLRIDENSQVKLLDLWSPFIQKTQGSSPGVEGLTAQSILMYDLTTDKVLYEKDPKTHHPMASITKIMTAIVSMENKRTDDKYIVHAESLVGEDSMGLSEGEVLTEDELLYGLMLPSGNDAAEVLATNYPEGREAFVKAMNDKAKSMGLVDTQFSNPSGLQGDGTQYTTASDLVVITKYALTHFPLFKQIVSTPTYDIAQSADHKAYSLTNETNLLTTYPGVHGVKTGFTPEAGLCLVTYLVYGNHEIIGVILNSQDRRGEMKTLLDYSLKSVGVEPPPYEEPQ